MTDVLLRGNSKQAENAPVAPHPAVLARLELPRGEVDFALSPVRAPAVYWRDLVWGANAGSFRPRQYDYKHAVKGEELCA